MQYGYERYYKNLIGIVYQIVGEELVKYDSHRLAPVGTAAMSKYPISNQHHPIKIKSLKH